MRYEGLETLSGSFVAHFIVQSLEFWEGYMMKEIPLQPLKVLRGLGSDLRLYNDRVVLHRTGWLSRLMQGDQTIFIGELESVNLIGPDERRVPYFRLNKSNGKRLIFIFKSDEWEAAQEVNSNLDYVLGHREPFPPSRIA